jgi:excisionase family DNA binding protein
MTSPTTEDRLLTPSEVAAMYRVARRTVQRWARTGQVGATRTPGGQWRVYEADVRAILARNENGPARCANTVTSP